MNFSLQQALENPFFVRQSGTFLFLAGLFYLYPLLNLKKLPQPSFYSLYSPRLWQYTFLIANAPYTTAQVMIYLAAFFDGLMAIVLVGVYFRIKMNINRSQKNDS